VCVLPGGTPGAVIPRAFLKSTPEMAENQDVPSPAPVVFALAVLTAASAAPSLPRGSDDFRLGMLRAEVDSAVAARRLPVISSTSAFLVCGSDDGSVEYEQYSFFQAPHGMTLLWKVTIGYHLDTPRQVLDQALAELERRLGEPASDTGSGAEPAPFSDAPPPPAERQVIWVDARTAVQLGARWSDAPDRAADRMMVTWTDRRLQRLVEARRKQAKPR